MPAPHTFHLPSRFQHPIKTMQQLLQTPSCLGNAVGSARDALENIKAGDAAAVQGGGGRGVGKKTGAGRKAMEEQSGGDQGDQGWALLRILRINYLSSLMDLDLDLDVRISRTIAAKPGGGDGGLQKAAAGPTGHQAPEGASESRLWQVRNARSWPIRARYVARCAPTL